MDERKEARLERQLKITSSAMLGDSDFNPSMLDKWFVTLGGYEPI